MVNDGHLACDGRG
uniref:Uncharacterized protein n=1 Tax=Anguilla anguilla TaxID=7936 RepID=A0A0E9RBD7_ANGAN